MNFLWLFIGSVLGFEIGFWYRLIFILDVFTRLLAKRFLNILKPKINNDFIYQDYNE